MIQIPQWLRTWFAKEPVVLWAALVNSVTAGTIWGVLPMFGINLPVADHAPILAVVNIINLCIVRNVVTAPANLPGPPPATVASSPASPQTSG